MEYKLIKKLPFVNSPEIGYISKPIKNMDRAHYWNMNWFYPEDYPEFWEKVFEKNYKILSFINVNNKIYQLQKDGRYFNTELKYNDYQYCLNILKIHSVKRLSDGEIFTIGDKTNFGLISNIIINNNNLSFYFEGKSCGYELQILIKLKRLFTTEDGVDIFEGDFVFQVKKDNYCLQYMSLGNNNISHQFDATKINNHLNLIFSTKEKAEEYILMNKPCLSYNEVLNAAKIRNKNTFDTLKDLIKSKINNK